MDENDGCRVVGRSMGRVDSGEKLTGRARYAGDITLPGMLWARVLRSDRPHARILAVRTEAAHAYPGVVAVLTHRDVPGGNLFGREMPDQEFLCSEKVRFVGDPVALVAAESEAAADAALARIEVDYEDLPALFSPEEALREGAPRIHAAGNILLERSLLKGDPERALAEADVVVTDTYRTQMVEHAYLEPEAGVALVEGGKLTLWMPSKHAHFDQRELAGILGMPAERIRIVNTTVGGCFGDKTSLSAGYYAALAALKTGRPVKSVYTREESFLATRKRHPFTIHYTTGATRDGRLLAVKARILIDTGAYAASGRSVLVKSLIHITGPYEVPHVSAEAVLVYTNTPVAGSMRGMGVPQTAFAHERQMDLLAERLGMDPFALREKNRFRPGSVTATGQRLNDSVGLGETIALVRREIERRGTPSPTDRLRYGWGVASMFYGIGVGTRSNPGRARLEVDDAGKFILFVGNGDVGQGSSTVLTQIAAEVLRCPMGDVRVVAGDTDVCPDSGTTAASRVTYIVGRAVQQAAENLLARLGAEAARRLGVPPGVLRYGAGGFQAPSGSGRSVGVAEAARGLRKAGEMPSGEGLYDPVAQPLDPKTGQGRPMETYAFATQGALVAVDVSSGETKVLTIVACHDAGRAVNPVSVTGQIEGAISMGLGFGLMEEIVLDRGRIRNPGFGGYFLPTAADMPEIVALVTEAPEETGPFGAKGVGEPALVPTAPAIVNAIRAATGIRVRELPAKSERLWALLQGGAGRQAS